MMGASVPVDERAPRTGRHAPAREENRAETAGELLASFSELTKPGITRLVLLTTAVGFYLASRGSLDLWLLAHTLIGTAFASSGTNALNQYVERDIDARMPRTRTRPLPSGRLRPRSALIFATVLAIAGIAYLAAWVNLTTAALVTLSVIGYIFVYTPLKQRTSVSTLIGAIPGALPIAAGWAAAGRPLDATAWILFWILFLWQIPHFLALAWLYRRDYRAGGLAMLSVFDPRGTRTGRHTVVYTLVLLPVSLLPTLLGLTGTVYFACALAFGAAFLAAAAGMLRHRTEHHARRLFLASVVYLPALLLAMVFDKVPA